MGELIVYQSSWCMSVRPSTLSNIYISKTSRPNATKFYLKNGIGVREGLHWVFTGVIQKVLPVLSTETLLHIWLSTEYYGFRPSSTAVDTGDTWS